MNIKENETQHKCKFALLNTHGLLKPETHFETSRSQIRSHFQAQLSTQSSWEFQEHSEEKRNWALHKTKSQ